MSTPHVDKPECKMASTAVNCGDHVSAGKIRPFPLVLGPSKNARFRGPYPGRKARGGIRIPLSLSPPFSIDYRRVYSKDWGREGWDDGKKPAIDFSNSLHHAFSGSDDATTKIERSTL